MKRLFWVTGASATGKSTLVENFNIPGSGFIALDIDLLRGDDWQQKKDSMIRIVSALDHVPQWKIVFGTVTKKQLNSCKSLSLFDRIEVLILTLDEDVLRKRLEIRGWPSRNIEFQADLNKSLSECKSWGRNVFSSFVNVTQLDEIGQRHCVENWLWESQK